jgi:hypothetical protein
MLDADALITVEIFLVSANCPSNERSGEALQVASIQFNNLDIIGMCMPHDTMLSCVMAQAVSGWLEFMVGRVLLGRASL